MRDCRARQGPVYTPMKACRWISGSTGENLFLNTTQDPAAQTASRVRIQQRTRIAQNGGTIQKGLPREDRIRKMAAHRMMFL